MKQIAAIVKDTRSTRQANLRDFATELGVSHMTVSLWENGKADPSPEVVGKLLASSVPWIKDMGLDIYAAQQRQTMSNALPNLTTITSQP